MIYDIFFNKINNIGIHLLKMSKLEIMYKNTEIVKMYAKYMNHTIECANLVFLNKIRDGMTPKEVKKEFIFCILQQMRIV